MRQDFGEDYEGKVKNGEKEETRDDDTLRALSGNRNRHRIQSLSLFLLYSGVLFGIPHIEWKSGSEYSSYGGNDSYYLSDGIFAGVSAFKL